MFDVVDQRGRAFSNGVVSRPSISSGSRPVYCQATATTGILMLGKISVGVRRIMTGLMMRMSSARMMKVYGRSRANLTIHIGKDSSSHWPLRANLALRRVMVSSSNMIHATPSRLALCSEGTYRKNR